MESPTLIVAEFPLADAAPADGAAPNDGSAHGAARDAAGSADAAPEDRAAPAEVEDRSSLQSLGGALAIFLMLGLDRVSVWSFSDAESAALDLAPRPLGEIYASTDPDRSPAFLLLLRLLCGWLKPAELPLRAAFVLIALGAAAWIWEIARKTLPRDWALAVAFLVALSPALLAAGRTLGPWGPGLFCAAAAIACLVHALRGGRTLAAPGEGADPIRRRRLARRAALWWAGGAAASAAAAVLHPAAGVLVAVGFVAAAPYLRDRRAWLGLAGSLALAAAALVHFGTWAGPAYAALFSGPPAHGGRLGLFCGDFVAPLRWWLLVPAALAYAAAVPWGLWQLLAAGSRGERVALGFALAALLALAASPLLGGPANALLLPAWALAAGTGLMFLPGGVRAALLALLLASHLASATCGAGGRDLADMSVREPHREIAARVAASLQPSDALLVAGDLGPFWRYFKEKPVLYRLELGPAGATVPGRKDPSTDAFVAAMRWERRRIWLLFRYPIDLPARGDFHRRIRVFGDWLAQNASVVDRWTFSCPIPDPEIPAATVERIHVWLVDPGPR